MQFGVTEDLEQPLPPRFRQLKIWSAVGVIAVLLLLGVRWRWGSYADGKMAAYIEAARARGEKVLGEDFEQPQDIPQTKNAAVVIRAATTQVGLTQAQDAWENNFSGDLPLAPADPKVIESIAWDKRPALDMLREARSRPYSDWQPRLAKPAFNTMLPYLNWTRQLANVAKYVAMYEHVSGNDAEAIERAEDILRLHESIGPSTPAIVCHLVGAGISSMDCDLVLMVAPKLDVSGTARAPATTRPATRQQVEGLIAHLLDEKPMRESAQMAWQGERMMILDYAPYFTKTAGNVPLAWLVEPMVKLDALRVARRHETVGKAIVMASLPLAAQATAPQPSTTQPSRLQKVTRAFDANVGIRATRFEATHFRVILDRRAAATMLALRLYALDHGDALPKALEELVPKYLPAVPLDPLAPAQQALSYRPNAVPPAIYSVGENGIDQQGSQAWSNPANTGKPSNRWQTMDVVYPISFAAREPGSTQPAK